MQMIPSADAIGQTECDVSSAIGARTFVTPVAFTQAATLSRASGSGSEGWKTRAGSFPSALGRSGRRERMIVSGGLGECALARGGQKHFWPEHSDPLSGYQRVCTFKPLMFRIGAPTADTQRVTHHSSEA
jgi:hypothetical protein